MTDNTELLVTEQKEIFTLENGDLYTINGDYQKLATGIVQWNYDSESHGLIFATASELNFYNFSTRQVQLITRSSDGFTNPILRSDLGYAFYVQNNNLLASEVDTSDHQNTYTLASVSGNTKFITDSPTKKIYLLDNGKLQTLTIR